MRKKGEGIQGTRARRHHPEPRELIAAMAAHPRLIERPIVVGKGSGPRPADGEDPRGPLSDRDSVPDSGGVRTASGTAAASATATGTAAAAASASGFRNRGRPGAAGLERPSGVPGTPLCLIDLPAPRCVPHNVVPGSPGRPDTVYSPGAEAGRRRPSAWSKPSNSPPKRPRRWATLGRREATASQRPRRPRMRGSAAGAASGAASGGSMITSWLFLRSRVAAGWIPCQGQDKSPRRRPLTWAIPQRLMRGCMNNQEVIMRNALPSTDLIAHSKALEAAGIAISLVMRVPAP